ncbi:Terpenoid cyclases/protein prenyltransferase alpha-alpha toroid [Penicillium vulpinum]|uniref:Squalene cyclase C-terminal domain-containing protein n=1 Tax=Penicillium vulpinum TaxID=29845 RepID=A0A1V6RXA4_9EURO|nr:Terpenoid cyclases/protein prenyltransferase alpha-alpha toroid [Penicillium vulpinum]KAJ5963616.1 Terpenoid cyclases/protein prenyltransferase alpha-alpha toroid [Penicillium vulpinum]OQE06043.1 hypothetical protein PENVUL_c020G03232 [Penicillium vulpinum]
MSSAILTQCARDLVQKVSTEMKLEYGMSSMAPSIYDTAWLAMIEKNTDQGPQWLFPGCFEYLIEHQNEEGGWDPLEQATRTVKYPANVWLPDCIIHSLAASLALCWHIRRAMPKGGDVPSDSLARLLRAKKFLDSKLHVWQLDGTTHFGYELLVPVLLRLLRDEGMTFEFPAKEALMEKYQKASDIDISWLYSSPCKIPLFCLEGFLEKLDFSRLQHLVTSAGIVASPASAASYLIYSPLWSDQCEAYLRHVVSHGQGKGNGAVGGVFPMEIFEPSWVLTALLENGFTVESLGREQVNDMVQMIHRNLENGVTGATVEFLPDADDTSRALTALNLHGYQISPAAMVEKFEVDQCFETFDARMPNRVKSVSVNGNVLNSLLHAPDPSAFTSQIEKIAKFMCGRWNTDRKFEDHWNLSEYYGLMHMAQSLVPLLVLWDQGGLPSLPEDLVQSVIPSCLQEAMVRILQQQNLDGSWGDIHSREETAYSIIALANLGSHAAVGDDFSRVELAIARGKQFLLENWQLGDKPDRIWTGKILHGISYVQDAYVVAALKVSRVNLAGKRGLCPN